MKPKISPWTVYIKFEFIKVHYSYDFPLFFTLNLTYQKPQTINKKVFPFKEQQNIQNPIIINYIYLPARVHTHLRCRHEKAFMIYCAR